MTIHLSAEDVPAFLARFWNFGDAVVRRVAIELTRDRPSRLAVVEVLARDSTASDQWVTCRLTMRRLAEFRVTEGRTSYQVLSGGLQIAWQDGIVFVDFGSDTELLGDAEAFRGSAFYFGCSSIEWEVRPYDAT